MLRTLTLLFSLFLTTANASTLGFETMPYSEKVYGDKILVQEFFFYGCPHCKRIESPLNEWILELDTSKVEFEKVPVNFGSKALQSAKHYYTAKLLGREVEFNKIYFSELVDKRKEVTDELAISILVKLGEKESSVKEAINSHSVEKSVERVKELTRDYRINKVPSFIVNGNIKVNAQTANGEKNIFNILDKLLKN